MEKKQFIQEKDVDPAKVLIALLLHKGIITEEEFIQCRKQFADEMNKQIEKELKGVHPDAGALFAMFLKHG